ncbi:MAG: hypothetical protein M3Y87_23830, partial [Myxococcota bacterium]|nr:hypothetical protein [Myxococcota bacterium]
LEGRRVVQLGLGVWHACALLDDGRVRCWGEGVGGALGRGDREIGRAPELVAALDHVSALHGVSGLDDVTQLAVGAEHTCALREDGTIACWGANGSGQLGDGVGDHPGAICEAHRTVFDCSDVPVGVVEVDDAVAIAAGASHTCAIRAGGEVACWGEGATMQLGDGTRTWSGRPVAVRGL